MTGTSAQTRRGVAACVFAAALAGCSSSPSAGDAAGTSTSAAVSTTAVAGSSSAAGTSATAAVITIKNFGFTTPSSVSPGATITVRNDDSEDHTVTADSGGAFDDKAPPGTSTFTAPSKPGSYPFHCTIHPFMKGTLVVK
jgi:plastocyanin